MTETPFEAGGPRPEKRGARLEQNQVRLRKQKSNGQYTITVPSGVAKALRCDGGEVFEVFVERGDIVLRMVTR